MDARLNAAAARALAWLLERHATDGSATVSDGRKEIVIIFRDRPAPEQEADLKTVHRRLLQILVPEPKTARTLCREAGYSLSSLALVRRGLSELVDMRKAFHSRHGYSSSTL